MSEERKIVYDKHVEEPEGIKIKGYDFNKGVDYSEIVKSFSSTGFQASHLSRAIEIVSKMVSNKAVIYLGYTSNMVSSGLRDIIRFIFEHEKINYGVTTGGGVEEDIIKCLGDFILGDFREDRKEMLNKGINRIGNILVPDDRYVKFEEFLIPILEEIYEEKKVVSPSDIVWRMGENINDERSICYWAWKNKIRLFCPTLMDGSVGDIIYVFKHKHPDIMVDVSEDTKLLNDSTAGIEKSGVILLGSGVVKHSILNANLFRNGADYAVYINTAQEFDGSDAGALPDEAQTWKKLKEDAEVVKVHGDASILFPILVAETFAKT